MEITKKTKQVVSYYNPKLWKEKGLIWTIRLFIITLFFILLILMYLWSREPASFNVTTHARTLQTSLGIPENQPLKNGSVVAATLSKVASTLLDKPGGFIENDKLPPGILMDNMPNWEFGVLSQVRDMSLAMRDDLSRSQSQSLEDKDLVTAQIRFNTDSEKWLIPPAESQYRQGIKAIDKYLKRLNTDEAQFYARADNLRFWLSKVERRLGSLSQKLSASVGQFRVNTDLAGDSAATESSTNAPAQRFVKTGYFKIDDVFYEARGQAWALLHFLKAVEADFDGVLRKKNALISLRQIIRELESTQKPIWSPVILNGRGFGFVTNHSLVMASYISRANAALIDLENLLRDG